MGFTFGLCMGSCFTEHSRNKSFRYNSKTSIACNAGKSNNSYSILVLQFAWRPRPPSLLSEQKEIEVKKNLRQYVERYEEEDEDVLDLLSRQEEEKRRVMEDEWEMWINKRKKLHEEEKLQRQNLLGEEEEKEYCYETVEELIDVCEEIVSLEL